MSLIDINGNPYTSATADMRLRQHKNAFRQALAQQITNSMMNSKDGRMQIDMRPLEEFIDQAYYMGREDAS